MYKSVAGGDNEPLLILCEGIKIHFIWWQVAGSKWQVGKWQVGKWASGQVGKYNQREDLLFTVHCSLFTVHCSLFTACPPFRPPVKQGTAIGEAQGQEGTNKKDEEVFQGKKDGQVEEESTRRP